MLSDAMLQALQSQLTLERQNAAIYDALSASLDNVNWSGSATFMKKSADEERTHAQKFTDYLVDRNCVPIYAALGPCPVLEDDDLVIYFQAALDREKLTTLAIKTLYQDAANDATGPDSQTQQFLLWFLAEQTASERELTDAMLELNRSDNNGRLILDERYGEAK